VVEKSLPHLLRKNRVVHLLSRVEVKFHNLILMPEVAKQEGVAVQEEVYLPLVVKAHNPGSTPEAVAVVEGGEEEGEEAHEAEAVAVVADAVPLHHDPLVVVVVVGEVSRPVDLAEVVGPVEPAE
jgi:hypothetical protein